MAIGKTTSQRQASDIVDTLQEALAEVRVRLAAVAEPAQEAQARLTARAAGLLLAIGDLVAAEELPVLAASAPLTQPEAKGLASGGFNLAAPPRGAVSPLDRASAEFARLILDSYPTAGAAQVLGVNASRVRQRIQGSDRTLYAIRIGSEWRVPKFQFAGKALIPGLDQVLRVLPVNLHPVAVHRWLTTANPDLPDDDGDETPLSPLDWLRTGRDPAVVASLAAGL